MEEKQEPEVVAVTASEEGDWLSEKSAQIARRRADYQSVDTVCDACQ